VLLGRRVGEPLQPVVAQPLRGLRLQPRQQIGGRGQVDDLHGVFVGEGVAAGLGPPAVGAVLVQRDAYVADQGRPVARDDDLLGALQQGTADASTPWSGVT
jgi:hypothetical protein